MQNTPSHFGKSDCELIRNARNFCFRGAERKLVLVVSCFRFCPKADRHRSAQNRQDWGGNADIPVRRNDDAASGLTYWNG